MQFVHEERLRFFRRKAHVPGRQGGGILIEKYKIENGRVANDWNCFDTNRNVFKPDRPRPRRQH